MKVFLIHNNYMIFRYFYLFLFIVIFVFHNFFIFFVSGNKKHRHQKNATLKHSRKIVL